MATYINPTIVRINGKTYPSITTKPIQVASITDVSAYVAPTYSGNLGAPASLIPSTANSVLTIGNEPFPIKVYCTQTTAQILTLINA